MAGRWPISRGRLDRKSTRLNSSHTVISYAVFCLKKKKKYKHIANHKYKPRQTVIVTDCKTNYNWFYIVWNLNCLFFPYGVLEVIFFFFNDTATTDIYTLSLHDALPICRHRDHHHLVCRPRCHPRVRTSAGPSP